MYRRSPKTSIFILTKTLEIIKLAENLKIPIIVALNKIDRIDDEKNSPVLNELYDNGLKLTKFGGNVPVKIN
jgi:translation initiation factor IF-2